MFGAIRPLLPYGWGIHESMLVPLPEAVHRQSAPQLDDERAAREPGGGYAAASPANQSGGYPAISPANQMRRVRRDRAGEPERRVSRGPAGAPRRLLSSFAPPPLQSGAGGGDHSGHQLHAGAATTGALEIAPRHAARRPRVPVVAAAALAAAVIAAGVYFISRPSPEPVSAAGGEGDRRDAPACGGHADVDRPGPTPTPAATPTTREVVACGGRAAAENAFRSSSLPAGASVGSGGQARDDAQRDPRYHRAARERALGVRIVFKKGRARRWPTSW